MQSTLMTFREAARRLPELTGHPAVDQETIRRWVVSGVRGPHGVKLKLAATRSGGRRYTSVAAVQAFVMACNGMEPSIPPRRVRSLTMAERRQRARRSNATQENRNLPGVCESRTGTGIVFGLLSGREIQDSQKTNHGT